MSAIRQFGPAMLGAALLWSLFYGAGVWASGVPAELLLMLPMAGVVAIGLAWPGSARGVATGLAAVAGLMLGVVLSGKLDTWTSGETPWFGLLAYGSIATAAHTLGSAIRHAVERRRQVAA